MRRVRRSLIRLTLCVCVGLGGTVLPVMSVAQQTSSAPGFLVVDQERLYNGSAFGQRVVETLLAESQALAEENRRIEDALVAEELSITDQRPTISTEDFRALADDFDERVTAIRAAQDRKVRSLTSRNEEERLRFLNAAVPVLGTIMQDLGAAALFDRRAVFLSDERIDITDEAIAAIDEALGTGEERTLETVPAPEPQPSEVETTPDVRE
jgi:Skp family chaperone for outer membrane proteins